MPQMQYPGEMSPWSPVDVVLTDVAFDFDFATQVDYSDPDPDTFEYSFEPWAAVEVTLFGSTAFEFDADQRETADPDADSFEYTFEPWSAVPVVLLEAIAYDFDADQRDTGEADPDAFEYYFEPWTDISVVTIVDFPASSEPVVLDEDEASPESAFEPGGDVLRDLLSVLDFTDAFFEEESIPSPESSYEPWVDYTPLVSFPDFDTCIELEPQADPEPFEWQFEKWTVVDIILISAPDYVFDFANADDDPVFDFWFEPWKDIVPGTSAGSGKQFIGEIQQMGQGSIVTASMGVT